MCAMRVLKFLITGMIGISVNLSVFHALYVLGVPYLAGSVAGLLISMVIGFLLQKYWTFWERTPERLRAQFALYAALALGNLALNTLIVYTLVGKLGVHYLIAQAIGAAFVAIDSFVTYHTFIFKRRQGSGGAAGV